MNAKTLLRRARTLYADRHLRHQWVRARLQMGDAQPKVPMSTGFGPQTFTRNSGIRKGEFA